MHCAPLSCAMKKLVDDFKRYGTGGLAILLWLTVVSTFLLISSVFNLSSATIESLFLLALLALILSIVSSRQVFTFPGTDSGISIAEGITFLAIVILGPYHAALLTCFDVLLASHRLK